MTDGNDSTALKDGTDTESPLEGGPERQDAKKKKLFGRAGRSGAGAGPGGAAKLKNRFRKLGKKQRRLIIIAAIALAAIIAALVLRSCSARKKTASVSYAEEAVSTQTITQALTSSGTLQPANSYTVTTLVSGSILSADFNEGDEVTKDDVLYEIDSSDTSNNIEKAQLSLNQAERNYQSAANKAYVKAAAAGTVYSLSVSVGDEVQAGQSVGIVRDSSTMTIKLTFPAGEAKNFYTGEDAAVTLDNSFETLSGTVVSVSGSDIVSSGNTLIRSVTIAVDNLGGLGGTQTATASVNGVNSIDSGSFAYKADSTLSAGSSGTVTAINAPEGTKVSKDQTIITLGGTSITNSLQEAGDNLSNAELSMSGTQDQLDNYTIKSPISGTIVDKQYKTGDKAESGKTLCTIYDLSYLEMTMSIDELDISNVKVGQTVAVTADAVAGKTYTGKITKVSVAGTTTNGTTTYPVTVEIDDTDGLLPGMNVNAEIVLAEADNVLAVPNAAVSRGSLVLVTKNSPSAANAVTGQTAPDGYVYVQVTTGVSSDSYIEITSGLQSGDTIAYAKAASSDSSKTAGNLLLGGGGGGGAPSGGGGNPGGGGGAPSGGGGNPGGGGQG